jgi:outer membrane protein assembly factor BamB
MPNRYMLSLALALSLTGFAPAQDVPSWPAFLGQQSQHIQNTALPLSWTIKENLLWKTPLVGHGQSSPVALGNQVYVTSVDGPMKDEFVLTCLQADTGAVAWTQKIKNSAPVANSTFVSRAAPTPVVDSDCVVVFYESGDCSAYSHDGSLIWQRDLGADLGRFVAEFGLGASLCQNAQHVFALIEHDGPSCLLALNKSTGETVWKTDRTSRRSWSSPSHFRIDGVDQIVISSSGSIDGYEASTGKALWTYGDVAGNTGVTPMDIGNGTFLVGAAQARPGESEAAAKQSNGLMRVARTADGWKAERVWTSDKLSVSWASPIEHRGLAYWVNRVGVVTCVDATTGEVRYAERLAQSCWATPIAVDNRIYFFGKDGTTTVIASGPEFQKLSDNPVVDPDDLPPDSAKNTSEKNQDLQNAASRFSGPTVYAAIALGSKFLIRIGNQIYCVGPTQP